MDLTNLYTSRVKITVWTTILLAVLIILMLVGFRLATVFGLSSEAWDTLTFAEKINFWIMSLRFDLKFTAIALCPTIIFGLLSSGHRRSTWLHLGAIYATILFFAICFAGIANYFYIKTYGHHFDLMIFGLFNEDTKAVLLSIWDGYPVILGTFACLIGGAVIYFLYILLHSLLGFFVYTQYIWNAAIYFVIFALCWAFFIRGDLGKFPLRRAAVAVTTNSAINDHVPCGLLAFSWTVSDYFKEQKIKYADPQDLKKVANFFKLPLGDDPKVVLEQVSSGVIAGRPHVVLAVMESMSTDMLQFDDPDNFDVYGSLRQVLQDPRVHSFTNVMSEGDGTIDSLGRILIRQGDNMEHSVGRYFRKPFFTSAAEPYRAQGYRTVLVTAGNKGWRNLGEFAIANGFEEVIDDTVIRQNNPDALGSTWGLYDEEMFLAAYDLLEHSDRPVFMVLLSITNHPPYALPANYQISRMEHSNAKVESAYHNKDIYDMYETFRYANDKLGDFFLQIIGNAKLSDKVVIAATGDHNVRGLNVYQKTDAIIRGHQVPLIVYAPVELNAQTDRFASHKDIMPTLFELSLTNAKYYYVGCNLFADEKTCPFAFAYNGSVTVTAEGMCQIDNGINRSFSIDGFVARELQDNGSCETAQAYRLLNEWFYRYQTVGLKPEETK